MHGGKGALNAETEKRGNRDWFRIHAFECAGVAGRPGGSSADSRVCATAGAPLEAPCARCFWPL